MVAGVCAGLSDYSGIDVTIIRLVVVLGSILGFGSLLVAYLVAWVLMPQEP
jgi:phage shock protein PspC (stress-responsive transcriptional regulator)